MGEEEVERNTVWLVIFMSKIEEAKTWISDFKFLLSMIVKFAC